VILRIVSTITAFILVACSDRPGSSNARNTRRVIINLQRQHAWLIEGQKTLLDTPVTTGRDGYQTPIGTFAIMRKERVYQSTVYGSYVSNASGRVVLSGIDRRKYYNLKKVRFEGAHMDYYMEFASGIGMHAGELTPYPSSHGCVRLPVAAARKFFQLLAIGCIVQVQNSSRPSYHSRTSAFNPLN
jgi:lipoprotein-anchoring transpeptidase ErfK/SrfK